MRWCIKVIGELFCFSSVSWRMVYSLSNAGINVNKRNSKGNTALHSACMKGYVDIGFNFIEVAVIIKKTVNLSRLIRVSFIQALFKVGIDPTIKNNHGNYASYYMEDIEQLNVIYKTHYPGIIAAVEKHSTKEVKQLLEGQLNWIFRPALANNVIFGF
jgi:Ankyrin repeats (many copies)